jgi:hypothetical protein
MRWLRRAGSKPGDRTDDPSGSLFRPAAEVPTPRLAVALLLVAVAVMWSHHHMITNGIFTMSDDLLDQYYPLVSDLFGRLREGTVPQWSPGILLGYPAMGAPDAHVFSPFHWPFLILPANVAVAVMVFSTTMSAALFFFLLGRQLGLSRIGSASAAVLWITSPSTAYMLQQPMALATVPWFPLVLAGWDRACRTGDGRWVAVAGGALGLAMLGGQWQLVYWWVVFLVIYAAVFILPRRPVHDIAANLARGLAGGAGLCVVALLTAAISMFPALELLRDSIRTTLAGDERVLVMDASYAQVVPALIHVLLGWPFGGQLLGAEGEYVIVGLLPVALAWLACGRGRSSENRWLGLCALFLLLALAAVFPPARLCVQNLPGNHFRHPERIAALFACGVAVLAGRGVERLLGRDSGSRHWGWLAWIAFAGVARGWLVRGTFDRVEIVREALAVALLIAAGLVATHLFWRRALTAGSLALVAVGAAIPMFEPGAAQPVISPLHGGGSLRVGPKGETGPWPPWYGAHIPTDDEAGPTRVLCLHCPGEDNVLLQTGHQTPQGYVSLRPARIERLLYARQRVESDEIDTQATIGRRQSLLDLLNVRFLLLPEALFERGFTEPRQRASLSVVSRVGDLLLVENATRLPRSFFMSHGVAVSSGDEAYARIQRHGFDPRRELVLESEVAIENAPESSDAPALVPASVIRYDPEEVQVRVNAPGTGWLVLLDRYAAGWSAEVNGGATPIYRANYLFRAVRVAAGESQVTFRYRSPRFWWGATLSLIGLGVAAAATVSIARGHARPAETASA